MESQGAKPKLERMYSCKPLAFMTKTGTWEDTKSIRFRYDSYRGTRTIVVEKWTKNAKLTDNHRINATIFKP